MGRASITVSAKTVTCAIPDHRAHGASYRIINWPADAGNVNAWAEPDVVDVSFRPSNQALHPGSARSASTTSLPSGPSETVVSTSSYLEGTRATAAPAGSTIRTRWATSAGCRTGWLSGVIRQSQPTSVWPTATRPGTASILLAVSWAAVSAERSTTKPAPRRSNSGLGSTPWPATSVATTLRSDAVTS